MSDQEAALAVERHHDQWHSDSMAECSNPACTLYRAFGRQAAALAEARRRADFARRLVNRLPLCPDHRDKFAPEACQACRAERAEQLLAEARRESEALREMLLRAMEAEDPDEWHMDAQALIAALAAGSDGPR